MSVFGGICPRCGQFHDLIVAVNGSIVCRNADEVAERIRRLEAERDVARAEVAALRERLERAPDGWEVVVAEKKGRREVLADLRAKVLGVRSTETRVRGGVITDLVDRASILALFDEEVK